MKKIIFDCDNTIGIEGCDVDDGLTLLYLLGCKDVEVLGITNCFGNIVLLIGQSLVPLPPHSIKFIIFAPRF